MRRWWTPSVTWDAEPDSRRLVAGVREFNAAARPFYEAVGLRPMQVRTDQPL